MKDSIFRPESGGNPKAAQTRIGTRSATAIGGQRAHDLRIGPQPSYVDADRSDLNRVMIEPLTGAKLRSICEERRALRQTTRAMKSSAAVGVAGIITFGHEAQKLFERLTPAQQDAAYHETAEAIADRLNSTLTGLVIHADESAPHAHFQLPAYDLTGHPISETAKRGALRDLQTITAEVMARHAPGIERGRSKLDRLKAGASPAEVVNRSVAQLHDDLPAEIAVKEAELAEVTAKLDTNRKRLAKAEADLARAIEQIGAESAKTEKIRKRAATYEARATKAQAEADRLATELAEIEGRAVEAEKRAQEARERARVAEGRAEALEAAVAPLRAAVAAYDAYKAAEAARISAIEVDQLRHQAENEAAAELFGKHIEATSLAVLLTDPDWDFSKMLADTPLDPKLSFPDMRQALIENRQFIRTLEYWIEGRPAGSENADIDSDLFRLQQCLQRSGGDVGPLKKESAWQRLLGDPVSALRKFFDAMVQKIVGERLADLKKSTPLPDAARPAAEWPEDLRHKIRSAKGPDLSI